MLAISRMESLMSPIYSLLPPNISKTKPFPHYLGSSSSLVSNSPSLFQNPIFLSLAASLSYPNSSVSFLDSIRCYSSSQSEDSQPSSSGEIRVIVGPMFAGKTTTLLRRIQLERNNGSFQAEYLKSSFKLDNTLKALCFSGRLREAIRLLLRSRLDVKWETYALLLQECIHRKEYEVGRRFHARMIVVGFVLNDYLKTKILILYAKAGRLGAASVLFDKSERKSLISWNAMIAGYVQSGLEDVGLRLYYEMRCRGLIPDQFTFSSVFRACSTLALLEQGKQAHGIMIKCQTGQNAVVNSSLMDMYFKCSNPSDGHRVFDKSLDRNVITWTALISGYGYNGRFLEVLELFHGMIDEGFRPNYVTLLAVLSACSHGGLVSEGWKYFSSMERVYGIRPKGKHYAAMVDLLGRAGRLREAYEFVKNSPCKEYPVVWGALLGACRSHGNIDLVKLSAKKFFELEPENAGKYVVLSNAYATNGLWENVAEVRGLMRDYIMRKDPGYSRIEVQNEAHFFFMNDSTHKQAEETNEMLKELTCSLKGAGYFPDISIEL